MLVGYVEFLYKAACFYDESLILFEKVKSLSLNASFKIRFLFFRLQRYIEESANQMIYAFF